ncbi:MAG: porin [Planctomycetales bacterium]|nr:porin [Planctomycetales bacterium]
MIKRSWKTLVAGLVMFGGVSASQAVSAGEVYAAGGEDTKCQQIFADSNKDLTVQLASMSCCEQSCCAPTECYTGCGDDGCGEGCNLFEECEESSINFGGWLQMGYHTNVTPAATTRNDFASFNNHPHRINVHQAWLYAEKEADGSEGLDWGFRTDVMYGVDASDTSSFGNSPGRWDNGGSFAKGAGYGWAIPQVYATLAAGDWSVKVGHFFTLVGYEVVTAPDNFFYSHALTMFNAEPFTHTGVLATYSGFENLTLYGGWTLGWDTGFDNLNQGNSFLGGFSTSLGDNVTFTYINTYGNFGWVDSQNGVNADDSYSHSVVIDVSLTDNLNYIFQTDHLNIDNPGGLVERDTTGINQYLIYSLNDIVSLGQRIEWWKDDGVSHYESTSGVNVKLLSNLVWRPEYRYDWSPAGGYDEKTFGMDMILTY